MSIIYEALKKVEKSTAPQKTDTERSRRLKPKIFLLYILLVCAGIFIANIFFNFLAGVSKVSINSPIVKVQQTQTTKSQAPVLSWELPTPESSKKEIPLPEVKKASLPVVVDTKRQSEPELTLNGVFFSQEEGYALINNRIVKEGDLVEGAVVKRIALDEVELDFQGSVIKLNSNK